MPQDSKKTGLSWSTPKTPEPEVTNTPAPITSTATESKLGFPSSKKAIPTHAPIYASFLVAGIIIGVLLATAQATYNQNKTLIAATSTQSAKVVPAASNIPAVGTTGSTPTEAPLRVSDQAAGQNVVISGLNIARPTWVVVYVSREGKPGNALGARLFFAGDKEGRVGLLRNTVAGQNYFVGLSVDNGDATFSLSKDKPLADADGGALWATFRAQ